MNVDILIRWGCRLLDYTEQWEAKHAEISAERLAEQYGWIRDFRDSLQGWGELLQIVKTVERFVRSHWLSRGCYHALTPLLTPLAHTERGRQISHRLLTFVRLESAKAAPKESLVGIIEVIEPAFGKQKRIENHQANSGFTGLILTLSAMVADTTQEVIHKALETASTSQVRQWCQQYLGPSIQAQRQAA